jgi:hypothetical protein
LNPLQEFFIGLDKPSQRLMLRGRFMLAEDTTGKSIAACLAVTASQVKQGKSWLMNELALS